MMDAMNSVYIGEFKDDKMDGKGRFESAKGYTYDGEWEDNKQDGKGKAAWADG